MKTALFSVSFFAGRSFFPAFLVLEILWSQVDFCRGDEPRKSPNVIFVLADDLGWTDTEPYGSTFHRTPHVRKLAEEGVRFTNAYSASPLCSPTRASILTGQWPARLRFTTPSGHVPDEVLDPIVPASSQPRHSVVSPQTRTRLPLEYVTYAELFRDAGYTTAFMGKWHLGRAPYLPENQGFDHVVGGRHHPGPPGGYFAPFKDIDTIPDAKDGEHVDDILAREAVRFIRENKEKPFLLNLWLYSVHAPFQGKPGLINSARERIPQSGSNHIQDCPTMAAMVETMDDNLGKVLDAVEAAGLSENTIVIFTSDNGGNMYSLVDGTIPTSNVPLRAGKGCIYEGGHRVPSIIKWPGHIKTGSTSDTVITSVDYYPTLLEMAGLDVPADLTLDGESLVPVLTSKGELKRDAIFCHFPHYTPATGNHPATSVRQGDWKLIRFFGGNIDRSDRFELYNLKSDLGERHNHASKEPDRVRTLNDRISGFLKDSQALVPRPNPRYVPPQPGWTLAGNPIPQNQPLEIPGQRTEIYSIETNEIPPVINRDAELTLKLFTKGEARGVVHWTVPDENGTGSKEFSFQPGEQELLILLPMGQLLTSLKIDFAPGESSISLHEIGLSLPENPVKAWTFSIR